MASESLEECRDEFADVDADARELRKRGRETALEEAGRSESETGGDDGSIRSSDDAYEGVPSRLDPKTVDEE
ncbi:hypothetical protein [Natrialba sp. INN-245]|uniref:hypothetical protein n=1 Tax=Natrialba sp. INN-245 TaxID=2690967 RepID=UPI001312FF1A|nr:hypothetical protein [Natrialba sp. INN-245]MWV39428.1 hypothetical protein [Natrialba sp. INN-245]